MEEGRSYIQSGPDGPVGGRYELCRPIARGGAGSVFEAVHQVTGARVAVKVLNAELRAHPEARARLLREARALTAATHPNVVEVVDAGTDEQWGPYLVMELLEGRLLGGILLARGRIAPDEAVRAAVQICEALTKVHAAGVVHRDVKPDNIFITQTAAGEIAKLLDFGVASAGDVHEQARTQKLTEAGSVLGTPEYMAPEQLTGDVDLDARCDVYGLGITLYECLTGAVPYEGPMGRIIQQLWTMPVPSPRDRRADIPEPLARVVVRAIARPPEDRFPTVAALAEALQRALDLRPGSGSLLGSRPIGAPEEPKRTAQTRPAVLTQTAGTAGPASGERPVDGPLERSAPHGAAAGEIAAANLAGQQRRRHERAPYVSPVTVSRPDGRTLFGRSEDISEGGMLVVTGQPCEGDELVKVRFALPGTGAFTEVRAVARWVRRGRGVGATGFEFVEPPSSVVEAIRAHVSCLSSRISSSLSQHRGE